MEISKAIFSVRAKKEDFYVSAFKHKLVFGQVTEGIYEEDKYFQFNFSVYHQIYIGLLPILKYLSGKSEENSGILLKYDNFLYKWSVTKESADGYPMISFESQCITLNFSLEEFNDLVYLLSELCFISMDLSFQNLSIFEALSHFEINELLKFQDKKILKKQLKLFLNDELSEMKLHFACELVFYNLDVIVLVSKLKSFFNEQKFICFLNLKRMIDFEEELAKN